MKQAQKNLFFPLTVLQQRVDELNEVIRRYAAFLRRKGRNSRWSMTKKAARNKMRLTQINRDSLKSAILQLKETNTERKIKFVYYKGHTCKVLGVYPDYAGRGDRSSLMIECTVAIPSYRFVVTKDQYQIAAYWD